MELQPAVAYLKAMANESRLRLLGLLSDRERSVGELAEILALREPTISHHLAKLHECGLVRMRRDGTAHLYRLDGELLGRLGRELFTPEQVATLAEGAGADRWDAKVLRTYVADGTLSKIPETRKKRDVVLRWLATRFEVGRRYPEAEVNEIIGAVHPDFATLRRELVGARLMAREDGVYWKIPSGGGGSS